MIRNIRKNAIIVDNAVLSKDQTAVLRKDSEVIIGGEPIIVTNYEYVNQTQQPRETAGEQREDQQAQGLNLKECLLGFYRYKKVIEQRKDPFPC